MAIYPKVKMTSTGQKSENLPVNFLTDLSTDVTIEGLTVSLSRDDSVRTRTVKFVVDNKEIFDKLATL